MITAVLCGAGFGAGAWTFWRGVRPPREDLADALAPAVALPPSPTDVEAGWAARAGAASVPLWQRCRFPGAKTAADLRTLGIPVERHLAEKTTAAVAGLVMPVLFAALTALAGVRIGWVLPVWGSLVLGGALSFAPDLIVRQKASERRAEVRHALSVMLDLTVVALSGGAGVEQALTAAASAGHGVGFAAFRRALQKADLTRTAAWGPLGELGSQLGVTELGELAATAALAGSEGARVKNSLATKAATLRGHLLAEAESDAASATERMSLPVVTLFGGFLLFLGYPAITHALTGL
ncbi:type II secretion system F family protein [Kitasatospora sp. NBC_01266]|uniref:type II secretion system F family protein n=1 Tax=Kitasatospora sp. NBC_01266 TaxID=2903572 RepID=UPI002E31721D|nr:type II secretion system F family protein [Kitasatospora sp. NBC_01266]